MVSAAFAVGKNDISETAIVNVRNNEIAIAVLFLDILISPLIL